MNKEFNFFDRIGGPWHLLRYFSIVIVFILIITQSFDIYGFITELKYVEKDYYTLSWDGVQGTEVSFYIVEIEEMILQSHSLYTKGLTLISAVKSVDTKIDIPIMDNHSYRFKVRAVFSDGSVSKASEFETLVICQLPDGFVSDRELAPFLFG